MLLHSGNLKCKQRFDPALFQNKTAKMPSKAVTIPTGLLHSELFSFFFFCFLWFDRRKHSCMVFTLQCL